VSNTNRSTLKKISLNRTYYLFLLPAIAVCLVFYYSPMFGVIMAFQDYNVVKGWLGSPFVGLKHFEHFLHDKYFISALKNTLGINGLAIVIGYPLPIIFSLIIFSMRDSVFKRVSQTISYMPHFLSWVVVAGFIYRMLDRNGGVVNLLIKQFGGTAIPFMSESKYFWGIAVASGIWKELGFITIIYLAALSSIPAEQYEAADIDGATGFQKLQYVTLPGLATTMSLVLIFTIGTLINTHGYFVMVPFDAIYNLRNPMIAATANTIDYYIYQAGVQDIKYSYAAAIGISQSILAFCMVYGGNLFSKKIQGYGAF
jgi:putative aldouronate transport system permease protein